MVCRKCGAQLREPAGYCPQCGEKYDFSAGQPDMKRCAACGALSPMQTEVCPGCGRPFAWSEPRKTADAYCPMCGRGLRQGAKFCPSCGLRLPGARPVRKKSRPEAPPSPYTGLFIGLCIGLSLLVAAQAYFLIWYFSR